MRSLTQEEGRKLQRVSRTSRDPVRLRQAIVHAFDERGFEALDQTGDDCFVLEVLARPMRHLEEVSGRIAGLGSVTTSVVYSSPLQRRAITG